MQLFSRLSRFFKRVTGRATISYVHGTSSTPLIGDTIGNFFDAQAARHANDIALIVKHQNIRWSYEEFQYHVNALAAGLTSLGISAGDRVGIWSPNNSEWTTTQFATAKIGAVLVNINPAYRSHELKYVLNKVQCKCLVMAPAMKHSNYIELLGAIAPELEHSKRDHLNLAQLPHLKHVVLLNQTHSAMHTYSSLLHFTTSPPTLPLQCDDPINIQFTSGTTGQPKGATLSHHNILNNAVFVGQRIGIQAQESICIPVPLYHCFGMVMGNLAAVAHGAAMVYPAETFDAAATLQAVASERCAALYGVPTMFIAMLQQQVTSPVDISSLRTGIMAGSICPEQVMRRVNKELNMKDVTICYGMTETSPVSLQTLPTDSFLNKTTTVGTVHPHLEVKIVDTENRIVPRGETGEVCVRGYSVMRGYWDDERATDAAIDRSGWMHTGDLASMDKEGYVTIRGRLKDMVIRGGENIYPREVEDFLYHCSIIRDVQVVGIPDEKYGEELVAFVILSSKLSEDEATNKIKRYCDGQLARYKIPKYFFFVESYPMTVTGKVKKFELRDIAKEKLRIE